jgi:hypothetical protein
VVALPSSRGKLTGAPKVSGRREKVQAPFYAKAIKTGEMEEESIGQKC